MALGQTILKFVDADQLPQLNFEFENQDLAAFTTIELRIRKQDGTQFTKNAIIDDAPNGLFHFEWAVGELSAGAHEAEVVFTDIGGLPETFPDDKPILLIVRDQV